MNRKAFFLSLFLLGLVSIVGQVIVLRELTISFYGNEFFIGVTIAFWLAWVAAGSIIPQKLRLPFGPRSLALLQLLAVVLLFTEIFAIRYLKASIGFPGEIPNLLIAFFVATLSPAPLCFILGMWWKAASGLLAKGSGRPSVTVNQGYFLETLGFIAGGIIFSFLLVTLPSFVTALILAVPTLVFSTYFAGGNARLRIAASALIIVGAILSYPAITALEDVSTAFRFRNQEVLTTLNSPFGQLTVTRTGDQTNFYESGLALGSDREESSAEELVHFPMLEHPRPASVLLIGGGFNGAVGEILKHGVDEVHYLELDPYLIALARHYLPPAMREELEDPRVRIVNEDGYRFLMTTDRKFDVIIINLPDPSTALLNRFYTEEFFKLAGDRLAENGILSTHLSFAPDQPIESLTKLNASVANGMRNAFSQILTLPEETNFYLATNGDALTYDPAPLIERYEQRGLENEFVIPPFIRYRLTTDRIEQARDLLSEVKGVDPNRNFRPIAYFYNTLHWLDHFYPRLERAFAAASSIFWPAAIFFIIVATVVFWRGGSTSSRPILSMAVAGFSLMACEIAIIFAYQTIVGYLYYRLALLIAALMAGMALGVWIGNWRIRRSSVTVRTLLWIHLTMTLFCALLYLVSTNLGAGFPIASEITLLILAEMAGLIGAMVFPIANHLYLSGRSDPAARTGTIYSTDVAGSAAGAILPSIILLPIYGVFQTLLFVGIVNLWIIGIALLKKPKAI